MSKAAKKRRFLRWRRYRQQCADTTRQHVPLTKGMGNAWTLAMYPVQGGRFYAMPPWHFNPHVGIGATCGLAIASPDEK